MSDLADLQHVNIQAHIDSEALVREIVRYLAAVDLYRSERCEPTWLPESAPRPIVHVRTPAPAKPAPSAH